MPKRHLKIIIVVILVSLICASQVSWKDRIFQYIMDQMATKSLEPIEEDKLWEGALTGLTQTATDYPYTCWLPQKDQEEYKNEFQGKVAGIGILNLVKDEKSGEYEFIPIMGMPTAQAGLHYGDRLVEVDGLAVKDLTFNKLIDQLRGEPNSKVTLTIRPYQANNHLKNISNTDTVNVPQETSKESTEKKKEKIEESSKKTNVSDPELKKVEIIRDMLQQSIICGDSRNADGSWNFVLETHPEIGYIRVVQFADLTIPDFKKALAEVEKQNVKKLIIDFRGNPGGFLRGAVDMSNIFLPPKLDIVTTRHRDGSVKYRFQSTSEGPKSEIPVVILIDHGSASAAEAVSACLQDHHRAVIVGTRSYGKGTVQEQFDLPWNMGMFRITDASFWRPSGVPLHRFKNSKETDDWGVHPSEGGLVAPDKKELEIIQTLRAFRESMNLVEATQATELYFSRNKEEIKNRQGNAPYYDRQLDKAISMDVTLK